MFLDYSDGIRLSQPVHDLAAKFDPGKTLTEEQEKEYRHRLLTRDQIGDFLAFVDMEEEYQKNVDNMKVKVESVRKTIEDVIAKAGCTYLK